MLTLMAELLIGGAGIAAEHGGKPVGSGSSSEHAADAASHDKPSHHKSSERGKRAGDEAQSETHAEYAEEKTADSPDDSKN